MKEGGKEGKKRNEKGSVRFLVIFENRKRKEETEK